MKMQAFFYDLNTEKSGIFHVFQSVLTQKPAFFMWFT